MASKDRLGKASEAAKAAQNNRYVQRLIEDEELRSNLIAAYGAARNAYGRMTNGKPAGKALLEDRKLQADLRVALEAVRDATIALTEAPKQRARKGMRLGRKLMIVSLGGTLALAGSEKLRSKVLDTLFGAEEEFEYTPPATNTPSAPPSTPVSTS